jgi:dolichyl-phosphate beta-glucosyltransferase
MLTLALPVKDGAERLHTCLEEIANFVDTFEGTCEVIIVDDGSTDATPELMQAFANDHAYLRVLRHPINSGKGAALKTAAAASRGKYLATIDADATYTLEPLPRFIEAIRSGCDAAIANRRDPSTQFVLHPRDFAYVGFRHAIGGVFAWLARSLLGLDAQDFQAGFKVFAGPVARRLFVEVEADHFGLDLEVLALMHAKGLRVAELPVTYRYDHQPSSVRLARDGFSLLRRLMIIRAKLHRWRLSGDFADHHRADYQELARTSGNPVQRFWHTQKWPLVESKLAFASDHRVLDAGAGSSEISGRISERVGFTCATDLSPAPLAHLAGSASPRADAFIGADLSGLPFADASFDKIVMLEVIEHLPGDQIEGVLGELVRTLAPGGQLLLTTPNYRSYWPVLEWLIDHLGGAAQMGGKQHISRFDPDRLRSALRRAGLRIANEGSVYHVSPFVFPLSMALAERAYAWEMRRGGRLGPILYAVAEKAAADEPESEPKKAQQ